MILRMKNFEYFWGSLKNPTFREGRHKKPEGAGLGQFANLRGELGKKEGVVF